MAYETIKVDIIPGAENAEVLHFSQYDNKRPFFIELFNGGAEFIPEEGMTLTLECRKRDGNIVILSDPVLTDNVAEFSTTEQLTACYGDNTAEIKIVDDNDLVIGSANFIINVEKSPTCGGLTSESEIDNLTQQIEDITQQVIGDDYYNKIETDALLENKANISDLANLASKAELENAIDEEDAALKNWAFTQFATPGYIANRYYNKTQVDELLFNMLPIDTSSGNPCSFNTEIAGVLQSLTVEIVASGGGGTPSAPKPIVGHSELNLTRFGVNFTDIADNTIAGGGYVIGGFPVAINSDNSILPSGNYVFSFDVQNATFPCACQLIWYRNGVEVGNTVVIINASGINAIPFTASGEFDSFVMFCNSSSGGAFTNFNLNIGSTPSSYAPYNGQTFTVAFGQTVYGGVYDANNGKLVVTHGYIASYNGESINEPWLSSIDTYVPNTTPTTGAEVVYPLATPIVIDVPSISVSAENGVNNIVSDCIGDVNVSYKDTIQHYIDSRI